MTIGSETHKVAIIDIGSNSVRMVIYGIHGSAALPYFNERSMPGLGRGLGDTGQMADDRMRDALITLRRFKAILTGLGVSEMHATATAAVRRASNGPQFARDVEIILGKPLRILSGADEAKLAALGVAAGLYKPVGLVGDLGGSSLELISIGGAPLTAGETFQLGPLALDSGEKFREKAIRKTVTTKLANSSQLKGGHKVFYAVGGAWRAIAKFHMQLYDYPLHVLNGYTIRTKDLRKTLKAVIQSNDSPAIRAQLETISKRRAPYLPYAAVVMDEVLRLGDIPEVVVSSNGLREGVLQDSLGFADGDPLLNGAASYARLSAPQLAFSQKLYDFVAPALAPEPDLFGSMNADERIDRAACLLADAGGLFHPDHRAEMAFYNALRAPYVAVTHAERCFIAHAVGTRYSRKFRLPEAYQGRIDTPQRLRARQLGACMRLGAVFSGRSAEVLSTARLRRDKQELVLQINGTSEAMISYAVEKRLSQAADNFSLKPKVELAGL